MGSYFSVEDLGERKKERKKERNKDIKQESKSDITKERKEALVLNHKPKAWKSPDTKAVRGDRNFDLRLKSADASITKRTHMGGCQNYGPLLCPYYNTAPII